MVTYKCTNCVFQGDTLSEVPLKKKCPVCGDEVKIMEIQIEETKIVEKIEEPIVEKEIVDVSDLDNKSKERVKDLKEDLEDDGKRNRSNKKSKKKW